MMIAIGYISSEQSKATAQTLEACKWLMEYYASNPLAIIQYTSSGMLLYIHSDSSFISDNPNNPDKPTI